jgi:myo-inositol-hexaphosphate 3-phosphohydrolase
MNGALKMGRSGDPVNGRRDMAPRAAGAVVVVALLLSAAFLTLPLRAGAAAEPVVVGQLQGEAMQMASGSGAVVSSGGVTALKLRSTGARATGTIAASAALSGVRIIAKGTQCAGAPRIRILLNGTQALATSVASTTFTAYNSAFARPAGTFTVSATLTNYTATSQCARTVSLDAVLLTASGTPTTPPPPGPGSFPAFGSATVTADYLATGAGNNVDTIAFWEAPNPVDSRMYVTSKNLSLVEVWKYPYASTADQLTPLTHNCLKASADSATNGVLVDQETDLLYVASNFSPNVCVFSLPALTHVRTITSGASYGLEPNLAMLNLPSGAKRLYVSNNNVVYVHDAATGAKLSQFTPAKGLETMWGDDHDSVVYIPDENTRTGVYAYNPDGTRYTRNAKTLFGDSSIFNADGEGILEYTCPASGTGDDGSGLIVVSDQIDNASTGNDYEVFDRRSWAFLGKIKLRLPSGAFVYNTDGIASIQQSSPQYPGGVLVAIQDDSSVAGVGWNKVLGAISAQTGSTFGC